MDAYGYPTTADLTMTVRADAVRAGDTIVERDGATLGVVGVSTVGGKTTIDLARGIWIMAPGPIVCVAGRKLTIARR